MADVPHRGGGKTVMSQTNWAGNLTYAAERLVDPISPRGLVAERCRLEGGLAQGGGHPRQTLLHGRERLVRSIRPAEGLLDAGQAPELALGACVVGRDRRQLLVGAERAERGDHGIQTLARRRIELGLSRDTPGEQQDGDKNERDAAAHVPHAMQRRRNRRPETGVNRG